MPPAVIAERLFVPPTTAKASSINTYGNCFEPMSETELAKILVSLSEATTPSTRKSKIVCLFLQRLARQLNVAPLEDILQATAAVSWITCRQLGRIFNHLPYPAERRFTATLFAQKIIDRYHRQQDLFSCLKCDTPTEKSLLHDIILQRR
ncbi:hypothetical protein K493DRAFT_303797 [Basidiobolus meristosporus CBS 931.73]|uniref:Uncharacterized protein n=1 Tax=Basidiobolus meristosporus CBS 931.73 TaxID=1314790 RepID=A0A1Y1Y2C9_9FUNG|nr:hypothetical protein K493DRAFT_303797 [Basidiobolus meristosporus CBS 931.73]|eukprot:ORX91774.1 hypothetical protein K493DRAFT_303797 [Basidiobolus meristosporus CBS 931.73]